MEEDFEDKLSVVLAREVEGFDALQSCQRLTAGASQESYKVALTVDGEERQYALRRAAGADINQLEGSIGLSTEARLLREMVIAGVPVPEVIGELAEDDGLGQGYLMEWLEGETLGQRIARSEDFAAVRPRLAYQCGEILGRIHNVDWQSAGLGDLLPIQSAGDLVDLQWNFYRDLDIPVPMLDYTWRWLRDNLPAASRQTLVHGDFRNGNLMVTREGVRAVLDWELSCIGDPLLDLGWLCTNSWRFGNRHLPVGGFGEVEDLLAGYAAETGIPVAADELRFWEVYGSFNWAIITLRMCESWRRGEAPGPERPVIGRRASEAQMDCVNLLIPGGYQLPDTAEAPPRGTQQPSPAEMLQSVADLLLQHATRAQDKRANFELRVAANSLGIVQREALYGPDLAAEERGRLGELLTTDGTLDELRWQLVEQLRDGLALDAPGLADHLRQTVACQLAVDQPGYSAI